MLINLNDLSRSNLLKIFFWGGEAVLYRRKQKGKVELELSYELGEEKNTFIKHEQSVSR